MSETEPRINATAEELRAAGWDEEYIARHQKELLTTAQERRPYVPDLTARINATAEELRAAGWAEEYIARHRQQLSDAKEPPLLDCVLCEKPNAERIVMRDVADGLAMMAVHDSCFDEANADLNRKESK